ncbi:hypothetical protein, partial [Paracoccus sp. (in: a-proteobacteria)]|uniref:hypothetical protein n=1 Tax=Paracoccus sp. TaxID=267 RepID=UPI0035B0A455
MAHSFRAGPRYRRWPAAVNNDRRPASFMHKYPAGVRGREAPGLAPWGFAHGNYIGAKAQGRNGPAHPHSEGSMMTDTKDISWDDSVLPFQLNQSGTRGRV